MSVADRVRHAVPIPAVGYRAVQQAYNRVLRPRLPRSMASCAGVPTPRHRLLDLHNSHPDYKRGVIEAMHEHCDGAHVEIVGLGWGVCAIHALRAGARDVVGYEAAAEMINIANQTFAACSWDPTERITTRHAVVGEGIDVYGEDVGEAIPPSELASEGVLVLDCEGAEVSILEGITDPPAVTIVETHPRWGAPNDETRALLEVLYDDVRQREYEPGHDGGKVVLVGCVTQ